MAKHATIHPNWRPPRDGEPGPNDPADARFPFHRDRFEMFEFLHGRGDPAPDAGHVVASVMPVIPNIVMGAATPSLGISFDQAVSEPSYDRIAKYNEQGEVEFVLPANPLSRAYALAAWNYILGILGEPSDRRVCQVWTNDKTISARGQELSWPVREWIFDGVPMVEHKPVVAVGRLTLEAWRMGAPLP